MGLVLPYVDAYETCIEWPYHRRMLPAPALLWELRERRCLAERADDADDGCLASREA